ncbi:MAG: hypothetical protein MJ184_10030 [Treponema sp.]|uniref:hypothetical protein n=1 Tax=Treponema sp. TaxID=166 RepID=UPI00298D68AE|nr:hypothetical protein [Treponema sp.]MCQ2601684.1 hypothetical protein [Treponema sp.]
MKKVFTYISLLWALFIFSSCSFLSINRTTSIVINFDSLIQSKAVSYPKTDVSYFIVSIDPKVQDDIKVNIADGETTAEFSELKTGTYKIKVFAYKEDDKKIAYGNSESFVLNPGETKDVPVTMKLLADYSTLEVGDIVLNDGTACSAAEYVTGSNSAVAVIVRSAAGDVPALGVGLVQDQIGLEWCINGSGAAQKSIRELEGTTTTGYMDGQDGWQILKEACSDAESNPEKYPAWQYCLNYAKVNNLEEEFAEGWYLPSLAELNAIYKNMAVINDSLLKTGGNQFLTKYYWSCNDYYSTPYAACILKFNGGDASYISKADKNNVCSVKVFK